jgi:hypothetical protein
MFTSTDLSNNFCLPRDIFLNDSRIKSDRPAG